ncbi:class I SAM-dependent methyltransferase [Winogradskya humida]|uniref:SAM-dependent methyltransferase n=1 Tax=Winogradskya humida TaxID=113566 RepID=A0ABQ3ZHK2_9ACTN|nr:class I SAM-dependent methyltransferase [Actinoplanes humidus]GIE18040.1 SAM-dependent methyltransferase [Actinoplanes humidus]
MAHEHKHDQPHDHDQKHDHKHQHETDPFAEMLDLDAEVLHEYHADLLGRVHAAVPGARRIVDVGSGTGTGSLALARRFPQAEVLALDLSEQLLAHLAHRAHGLNIRTQQADLDEGLPALEPVDLAWASASMHHMADPDRVVAEILTALRPGGVFAVVELTGFPRFVRGDDNVEARLHTLLKAQHEEHVPHMGDDWGARLAKAGFTVETEQHFPIALTAPLPRATARYAEVSLLRLREKFEADLGAADLAELDTLIGDLPNRGDLTVRTDRSLWLARRPL